MKYELWNNEKNDNDDNDDNDDDDDNYAIGNDDDDHDGVDDVDIVDRHLMETCNRVTNLVQRYKPAKQISCLHFGIGI